MAPFFCYHVPRHLWETEESTPGKNNWQTIKSSLSTSSDQFICVYIIHTPTDSLFSAVKYSSQGRPGHQPTECWDHEAGAGATDRLRGPSTCWWPVLIEQVDASWHLVTLRSGHFCDSFDCGRLFFWGGLFSTCGTCVREGVSSLTGTLRLKLFLHPVTGTSWTWNELTNLVICKKYLHFQWTQGGWWPYPRWRLLDGLWSTARDRQMGVYGGGQARGRWQT